MGAGFGGRYVDAGEAVLLAPFSTTLCFEQEMVIETIRKTEKQTVSLSVEVELKFIKDNYLLGFNRQAIVEPGNNSLFINPLTTLIKIHLLSSFAMCGGCWRASHLFCPGSSNGFDDCFFQQVFSDGLVITYELSDDLSLVIKDIALGDTVIGGVIV